MVDKISRENRLRCLYWSSKGDSLNYWKAILEITAIVLILVATGASQATNITLPGGIILEKKVNAGDLIANFLTIVALLFTMYNIVAAIKKDRIIRQKDKADKVRNAAAKAIADLTRWREQTLSIFQDVDNTLVRSIDGTRGIIDQNHFANNVLEELKNIRTTTCKKRLEETNRINYDDIYDYDPLVGMFFTQILAHLTNDEATMFNNALLPGIKNIIINNGYSIEGQDASGGIDKSRMLDSLNEYILLIKKIYESQLNTLVLTKLGSYLLSPILSDDDETILETRKKYFDFPSMKITPTNSDVYLAHDEAEPLLVIGKVQ